MREKKHIEKFTSAEQGLEDTTVAQTSTIMYLEENWPTTDPAKDLILLPQADTPKSQLTKSSHIYWKK